MIVLISCQEDDNKIGVLPQEQDGNIISKVPNATANNTLDWENTTTITFGNGNIKTLPWYNGSITPAPNYILTDFRKVDGWELLYNFCNQPIDQGKWYLIFYNKFTGKIRSYYFLEDPVAGGSDGVWGLMTTNTHSLLNNTGYFAYPINCPVTNPFVYTTNISTNATNKAIAKGWNVFETEITYDPNSSSKPIWMSIQPSENNISNITIAGSFNSKSEGTIVSSSSSSFVSSILGAAAKGAGNVAGDWIKSACGLKDNSNAFIKVGVGALSGIMSGGTDKLINAGVNLVFGSFISRFSQPSTSTSKLEFKTNGSITLSGTITSSQASNAVSVNNLVVPGTQRTPIDNIFPLFDKKLGVWNLANKPIVKQSNKAMLNGVGDGSYPLYYYSRWSYLDETSINVVINDDLLPEIVKYEVSTDLIYYKKFDGKLNWRYELDQVNGITSSTDQGELIYKDSQNEFYKDFSESFNSHISPDYPSDYPNMPPDQEVGVPYINYPHINNHYVVKVTVKIFPKSPYNQDPIVITRSYLPDYVLFDELDF